MAHNNTVFSQLLKLISRHEFETLGKQHHRGRSFRNNSRWSQFVVMMMGQLSGRKSLRDMIDNFGAQSHRLYHLGSRMVSRSSLSRINNDKPYTLYEALFAKLLTRCQGLAPRHGFRFKNPLYSLDATTIDLCLSVFPWAKFRTTKAAVKLHVGLNHAGHLPEFVAVSEGNKHGVNMGKVLNFPKGSIVAIDKGYNDYGWYNQLTIKGIFFVTRLKTNAAYRVIERREVDKSKGLSSDQTIEFTGAITSKKCPIQLRRIGYRDAQTGKRYVFLTNNFKLSAKTIAQIYKARWDVELFFKWIKQNLKIKTFVGTSKNAVLTQIWIALCVYLLLAFIKFQSRLGRSLQQILRLLQINLFEKRDLLALLRGDPINETTHDCSQMALL
ncbi:MAG: IS4 family transposase [Candidatus Thiodiazotropha lotti]|uniref:IS4 family transposase n=1 Tax=Candidatus Thiodiazotropha lotti TaxID=2792787 RepID=A0A9E4N0N3_9GAMM|nr:IS4 family transposase [Candidatus Thiodiazotropha lotti]MCW4203191.1 IS4 family transposase [Candidatus Thiodiazotropha lotti]